MHRPPVKANASSPELWKIQRSKALIPCTVSALLAIAVTAAAQVASAQETVSVASEERELTVTRVLDGLANPWSIAFINESEWLVTEREGRLRQVKAGKLLGTPVAGLPEIAASGQGGLLDVVLHPDYAENNRLYLSYAAGSGRGIGTEVLSATLKDNTLNDVQVIFRALPKQRGGRHFGSRLAFDADNKLYISLGDRGERGSAQERLQHAGSIIRLNDDGSIPPDNPFINDADTHPEIYSLGHRNVQGMVFDKTTNTLWSHEHGPQGGDELNRVIAGQNYGWPVITYGGNYGTGSPIGEGTEKPGMQQPVTYWDPSIAPSGLAIVNSERYPEWQGNLLVGALKYQLIARLVIDDGKVVHEERMLRSLFGRIRDVRIGPDGFIYFLTDSRDGAVYRIE